MSRGLDATIEPGGATLSGGQRQRLSIARALLRNPALLVFDDAFSALDTVTDARVRAAIARRNASAGLLVIAQRVSTITDADRIIVLETGRVVGTGRHEELVVSCPAYAEIVASQLSLEESA